MKKNVCKYCIATKGLKGSELEKCEYAFDNDEELAQHIETEHHTPVKREEETSEKCIERFKKENPDSGGPNCKCPTCQAKRGDPRHAIVNSILQREVGG